MMHHQMVFPSQHYTLISTQGSSFLGIKVEWLSVLNSLNSADSDDLLDTSILNYSLVMQVRIFKFKPEPFSAESSFMSLQGI